jgi:hypothetical protein
VPTSWPSTTCASTTRGAVGPEGGDRVIPGQDLRLVFEIEAGRIASHRTYYDQMDFAQQLGLIPEPAAAS